MNWGNHGRFDYNAGMCQNDSKRSVTVGEVIVNEPICAEHFRLIVRCESFGPCAAGQFVQLQCADADGQYAAPHAIEEQSDGWWTLQDPELTGQAALLRRPISLAGAVQKPDGVHLEMIYRVVGVGTNFLSRLKPGGSLGVLGPLGNPFLIPAEKSTAVLIGGGVGIPPMLYLAESLQAAGKNAIAFCGVRREHLLPLTPEGEPIDTTGQPTMCLAEFNVRNTPAVVACDDGTVGREGLVTNALLHWLRESKTPHDQIVAYSCGPEPMMKALAELCSELGISCKLSLERHMACGMGTCQSCVVKLRDDSPDGWRYGLCCKDGPVFDFERVLPLLGVREV